MITSAEVVAGKKRIADRFVDQCNLGPQVKELPSDVKACGQYLDERVWAQRGIHGTAAAIRVLAEDGRREAHDLLPQLIRYLENRPSYEKAVAPTDNTWLDNQLTRDSNNVIKISEALFALDFVETAVYPTDKLSEALADRLKKAALQERGWSYFLDRAGEPQLLPTAYAVRALARHGYDVDGPVRFLLSALTTPSSATTGISRADISVQVFCLFVLRYGKKVGPLVPQEQLRRVYISIWRRLESLLDDDIEQNIEYARDRENYYVRVPWQLYLIALSCGLAPTRGFASQAVQGRLRSILDAVGSREGFVYPHSGGQVSSRTNAISYDVLSVVLDQLPRASPWLFLAHVADGARKSLSSTLVKVTLAVAALILMALSVYTWYTEGGKLKDLAPNFLVWVILLVLSARKAR